MNDLELIPFRTLLDQVVVPARRHLRETLLGVAVPLVFASLAASIAQVRWSRMLLDPALQQDPEIFLLSAFTFLAVALASLCVFGTAYWALMVASMDAVAGREVRMGRAWKYVFRPRVLATFVLVGVADFLALLMFFLPALYVVPLFAYTLPVMVEEKKYGVDAMRRSAELFRFNATGRPHHNPWLQTLILLFVGFVITNAVGGVAQAPFVVAQQLVALREATTSQEVAQQLTTVLWLQVPSSVLGALATSATWLYTTFGTCLLYRELRRRKEADDLAEAIDRLTGEARAAPEAAEVRGKWAPGLSAGLLLVLATGSAPPASGQDLRLAPATADRTVLEEIVRGEGVRSVPDRPRLARYAEDLVSALREAFAGRLERLEPETFDSLARIARVTAQAVFVIAIALLTATVVRALVDDYRRRRGQAIGVEAVIPAEAPAADRPEGRSSEDWAADLRRRLASGEAAAACHALWWWLAAILAQGTAEAVVSPSWTSRELIARAGRYDLAGPVRRLDRMLYGAAAPGVEDVRRLWDDLEEAVG